MVKLKNCWIGTEIGMIGSKYVPCDYDRGDKKTKRQKDKKDKKIQQQKRQK